MLRLHLKDRTVWHDIENDCALEEAKKLMKDLNWYDDYDNVNP
jgi:hypothetical protein